MSRARRQIARDRRDDASPPPPSPTGTPSDAARPAAIFRREAVARHDAGDGGGDVLRLAPAWIHATYWLLLLVFLASVAYLVLATFDEHAQGRAVVRAEGHHRVTARMAGTVASVAVKPGQSVAAGDLLVRFHAAEAAAALARVERELDLALLRYLRDPADVGARSALTSLRASREEARARLDEHSITASEPGTIGEVRVSPGQVVQPGDTLLTFGDGGACCTVVALIPGRHRPVIAVGTPLRLTLDGYASTTIELEIESVADHVVGPQEARRLLGRELADSVPAEGPVVIATARTASAAFEVDGVELRYFDGMTGVAEVRVRRRTFIEALVPGLERLSF